MMSIKGIMMATGIVLMMLSPSALLSDPTTFNNNVVVALDYVFDQDCNESSICFGFVDSMESFEYNLESGIIHIETYMPTNCTRDGILRDRFQFVVKVELNGAMVGTLKRLEYDLANGIIWIDTNELNFNC